MSADARIQIAGDLLVILEHFERSDEVAVLRNLMVRLRSPQCFITVCGETSTGKSSLINGLIVSPMLPVAANPTTGVVTQVICRSESPPSFYSIYKDATQMKLDYQRFKALSLEPTQDLLRLQLRCTPKKVEQIGMQVFDTPGYNSIIAEHARILSEFLNQSDLIVFVVGYRSGFGQVDQDLLELIGSAVAEDTDIPIVLVVNRTPDTVDVNNNKRIQDCLSNATDSIKRVPYLSIVHSATEPINASDPAVPDTDELWAKVTGLSNSPNRIAKVDAKLTALLDIMLRDTDEILIRNEAILNANAESYAFILEIIACLEEAQKESIDAVEQTVASLKSRIPLLIHRIQESISKKICADIDNSNKWLGAQECTQWLQAHALPFAVKDGAKVIEDEILNTLMALDSKLNDIANTAVKKINETISLKSTIVADFAKSITKTIALRVGGKWIKAALESIGGVGGLAAGTGNLAKMLVKKAGRLVGKTFSRGTYTQIGKIFTKKVVERLTFIVAIAIDAGAFIYDAVTWRKDLKNKINNSLLEWKNETCNDFLEKQLLDIKAMNIDSVNNYYNDLISEKNTAADISDEELEKKKIQVHAYRELLNCLINNFSEFKNKEKNNE